MSFDLGVSGGRMLTVERWQRRIARFGVDVEFHPEFRLETHAGYLPLAVTVGDRATFRGAARYQRAGRLEAGFTLGVFALGPHAEPELVARRRRVFEDRLEKARPNGPAMEFPILMLQSCDDGRQQSLSFVTNAGRSGADYLAQVVCAAAYALDAGGTLGDPQEGQSAKGDDILGMTARLLDDLLGQARDNVVVGNAFTTW